MENSIINGISPISIVLYLLNIGIFIGLFFALFWFIKTVKSNREALRRIEEKIDHLK